MMTVECRFLLPLIFALACLQPAAQTTISGSFEHGKKTRTYTVYIPATYKAGKAVPLVIGLHGLGSSGEDFARYRDFRPIADTANFIFVTPDGTKILGQRFWNYGRVMGSKVDDAGFIEALIDTLSARYTIDQKRVYCTGMSNGSFLAYALAVNTTRFAAVSGVTGSMSASLYKTGAPQSPVAVLHIHGTADRINPYKGTGTMAGIEKLISFWVNNNGCNPVADTLDLPDTDASDGATATRYSYRGGKNNSNVVLIRITGGEHSWPGSPLPRSKEKTCMDFKAEQIIWDFFRQHAK